MQLSKSTNSLFNASFNGSNVNAVGAAISEEQRTYEHDTRDILLPNQVEYVSQIAVDIGGSLAKIVWFSRSPSTLGGRLNFCKFETEKIEDCVNFIAKILNETNDVDGVKVTDRVLKATGGGAHKFYDYISEKLGVTIEKEDEMECLITGLNFLVKQIPNEVFTYDEKLAQPMCFEDTPTPEELFPYLLVNIGSGVSILKVTGDDTYERISGTSLGGGTLWGLLSLITNAQTYDEMLELSKHGDNKNVDMLVGDIYGTDYSKIGLKASTIASSFGKVFKKPPTERKLFKNEDISRSLLYMVSNNIGQIAYLNAQAHNIKRIYFGGCFIRGHPATMNTLSYAINFWSRGKVKALFLRHEGYLGSVGAFLKHTPANHLAGFFTENFTLPTKINPSSVNAVGVLEKWPDMLVPFPLLSSVSAYHPDMMDLTDPVKQTYWIDLLERNLSGIVEAAIDWGASAAVRAGVAPANTTCTTTSTNGSPGKSQDAKIRATRFEELYRSHLRRLRKEPGVYGQLSVRSLLILREQCLHELGFTDIFASVKKSENEAALKTLPSLLSQIDSTPEPAKLRLLIDNILAGNMYDWGATNMLELLRRGELDFDSAKQRVGHPSHLDQFELLQYRFMNGPIHRRAVIFVDNSGADIILGILPFTRYLLSRGTQVILAPNTFPSVNDVTVSELKEIVQACEFDTVLTNAFQSGDLKIIGTGGGSPCIDLRRVSDELCRETVSADLVVLEGMGRAIHTNYFAEFAVDHLKLASIKNAAVAEHLGAALYDGIVLFRSGVVRKVSSDASLVCGGGD